MYWGRPVKIDTALYPISTQRNLAVAPDDISMPLNRRGGPWYSCVCCRIPMYHPAPPKTYLQIHMYHPFTSKASLFPAAKKIMVDTYVSFFRQEPSTCAPVRAQSCADQNFFFRAFRTFSSCLLCIPCPRSCSRESAA